MRMGSEAASQASDEGVQYGGISDMIHLGVPQRKASGSRSPLYSSLVPRCGVPLLSVTPDPYLTRNEQTEYHQCAHFRGTLQ